MSPNAFREFLQNQKQQAPAENEIDWAGKLATWQAAVESFIDQVKAYLSEFSDDIHIKNGTVTLSEEFLGTYEVPSLTLKLPAGRVLIKPVGTNLIGASGRIDMEGPEGKVKWVLVPESSERPKITVQIREDIDEPLVTPEDKPEKRVWKLATPPPNIRLVAMTKDTFLEAVMEVANG
ncbi:MAG: hypothetical protein IBX50_17840 [Marinospirillum sp.]|uniref:hypothetical protein n=1 Tax=Marinospirillum sp. TaxID=2183934 RepID=UPI0019E52305|nr:hypothetical protein [Marinospirillum sp.]MBE0508550.1 hypothetical protein [Marinospirillum sp.]